MTFGGLRTLFLAVYFPVIAGVGVLAITVEDEPPWTNPTPQDVPLESASLDGVGQATYPLDVGIVGGITIIMLITGLLLGPARNTRSVETEVPLRMLPRPFVAWCVVVFLLGLSGPLAGGINLWAGAALLGAFWWASRQLEKARCRLPENVWAVPSPGPGWAGYSVAGWDGAWSSRQPPPAPDPSSTTRSDPRRGSTALDAIRGEQPREV